MHVIPSIRSFQKDNDEGIVRLNTKISTLCCQDIKELKIIKDVFVERCMNTTNMIKKFGKERNVLWMMDKLMLIV